jgi:predicted enzyme related to lactoylglutathione lyase
MANIDKHAPGSFCWIELGTSDQNAAKNFYASLFGWTVQDFPMGPDQFYSMFNLDNRNTGGGYTLQPDMVAAGVPPHWMLYIAVESADASAEKAGKLGAKVEAGPFDVFNFGRMAVLHDPTGAAVSLWQPMSHTGIGIAGVPGTLCWADLMTPDVPAAKKFYSGLFGWTIEAGEHDPSGYLHIKNGEHFIGGIPPKQGNPQAPPHWLLYFLVDNCDAAAAKASGLGAKVLVPPMSMEGVGRWSIIADPQGAVFSLFQPAEHR